jgi:hypothetical protein
MKWPSVLLACALVGACSGPQAAVTIGGKAVPVEVAFGLPERGVMQPSVPTVLVPVPGGIGVVPVPVTALPPSTPVPATDVRPPAPLPAAASCPEPAAGVFPRQSATPVVVGVTGLGSYRVRYTARVVEDGKARVFSGLARHTVTAATALPGGATTFDITVTMLGADTSYTWTTLPGTYNAVGASSGGQIALRAAHGAGGLGYEASFQPANPVEVMALPAYRGATFTSGGTDAGTGTVARLDGNVVDHRVVNACGVPVDTWEAKTTLVTTSPNQNLTTVLSTAFATAHGGLPVAQTESYSGTAGGKAVSGSLTWTFSDAPKAAS